MSDFVKRPDLDFIAQLSNFEIKLSSYKVALNLTDSQENAAKADAAFLTFAVLANGEAKTYKQGWTDLKNAARSGAGAAAINNFPVAVNLTDPPAAVLPGAEDRFRALVAQIKANPAYTNAMGEDLGIVADESTTTLTKPVLTIKLEGGNPVIGFKKGSSNGIKLYSKRGAEAAFSFLAVDTRSPYVDNRPNQTDGTAETRQYYAYFIVNDEQVGAQSDVISIKV